MESLNKYQEIVLIAYDCLPNKYADGAIFRPLAHTTAK